MATFEISAPDGSKYAVDANSMDEANQILKAHRQQEVNKAGVDQANAAPEWVKPFMAVGDAAQTAVDTISGGLVPAGIDKATDYFKGTQGTDTEQMKVAAARDRMGWAGTGIDALAMARLGVGLPMLPTMVPKAVAALGGGPAARTITGTLGSATEGGLYGGINAATHDQDVGTGTGLGVAGGVIGNTIGNIVNRGKMAVDKLRGVNYDAPQYNLKKLPPTPDAKDYANQADFAARKAASTMRNPMALADQYAKKFGKVADDAPRGTFSKEQRGLLDTIQNPDPATNVARWGGDLLSNKLLAGGAGASAGYASGNPLAILAPIAGFLGGGKVAHEVALGGPKEAVARLRASTYGKQPFQPPISERSKVRIGNAARTWMIDENGQLVPGD